MLELPPLSLYVHIPWCVRKCPYCDFNSHEAVASIPEQDYVRAVLDDLRFEASRLASSEPRPLQSIFIGGGTPSLFSAASIAEILTEAENLLGFSDAIEITLEANPGTAEAGRFKDYRACGINRLSLGVQSFQDEKLTVLGRIHSADEALAAIALCQDAGFDNFNLDLMYGLPGQTVAEAIQDLQRATQTGATHVSWYQLTIEANTAFYSDPPQLPDDAQTSEMAEAGIQLLKQAGYERYEVSAYCREERPSRHNLNYWQYGDYLGVGAGAHGKLSAPLQNCILRNRKRKQPKHYLNAVLNREAERIEVTLEERPLEYLMNALRLPAGFTRQEFEQRTGVTFAVIAKQVECLISQQLLAWQGNHITTTDRGFRVLNTVLEQFLESG